MSDKKTTDNFRKNGMTLAGHYYAPFKSEKLVTRIMCCVLAVLSIVLTGLFMAYYSKNRDGSSTDAMLIASMFVIWLVIEIVFIIAVSYVIRKVRGGFKCSYTDDGERFITNEGGILRSFWYWEVKNILFVPRESFGKVRGYDITISLVSRDEVYSVTSDNYISKETTPFMVVQQRVDELKQKKSHEEYIKEVRAMGSDAVSNGTQSTSQDRLGMDAQMPAVSAHAKQENNNCDLTQTGDTYAE